jgi:MFS superfamily sulfate permease-like transporter/CRP-like cAMP-binding protein
LFLAPFLATMAERIDDVLQANEDACNEATFLATFGVVLAMGFALSGILCVAAARIKLANLGLFLPYAVLCGFFTSIGILMWTLAFSVDTGYKIQHVPADQWGAALMHHAPSLVLGVLMHLAGRQHPIAAVVFVVATCAGSYGILWLTGTSLEQATADRWFFSSEDLVSYPGSDRGYGPPWPLGVWAVLVRGEVVWSAVKAALPHMLALSILYLIRCSLHAAALKKNLPNVTRKETLQTLEQRREQQQKKKERLTLNYILQYGYGFSQILSAVIGGVTVAPALAASLTLFHLRAEKIAPQFGSCLLLLIFYCTNFGLVHYIPKPAFSCLLVLAALDMCRTWMVGSFRKTKDKIEWMVAPVLVVLAFTVGMLNAILLGIAVSTFLFVANFYSAGVVRFVGSGLSLRSTMERGVEEAGYLDQNADLIQVLVLQNYLFFGNVQSVANYITTMFAEDDEGPRAVEETPAYTLPPVPKYVIVDLTMVAGMDTSAVDQFREIVELCRDHGCQLFLTGMSPNLKSMLLYAGLKSEPNLLVYISDLERAMGKAEDGLLWSEFHLEERDKEESEHRSRHCRASGVEDGFLYALQKIDEQHGLRTEEQLQDLRSLTLPIELQPGDVLECGSLGLYFIETGLMNLLPAQGRSAISQSSQVGPRHSAESIGHLNARAASLGREAAKWKHARTRQNEQHVRLVRIGQGWVIGSMETASGGIQRTGTYVAISPCRLHHIPHSAVQEIEAMDPTLAMHLYKLLSLLSSKRQETTISQLAQFVKIMTTPIPRLRGGKKELA